MFRRAAPLDQGPDPQAHDIVPALRLVARAILLFQGAACVHPVMDAWYRCDGIDGCMSYLAEWPAVLRVWLVAAAAWVAIQILPLGLKLLDDYRLRHRRSVLAARREAITAEWGPDDEPLQ